MRTVTFFDTREELRELTGLPGDNHDQALWDAGFNLDDWDFGFVCDEIWAEDGWYNGDSRYFEHWLLDRMSSYCVGYDHVEYAGKHYYVLHHA